MTEGNRKSFSASMLLYRGTHHEHVQVFIDSVDSVGPSRVGRRWDDITLAADADDVRCMPSTSSLNKAIKRWQ